jgi:hypothetical protein
MWTAAMDTSDKCDVCADRWEVQFEWDYTGTERYCRKHILEPIEGQPGKTLLDYMPDCQHVTHRLTINRFGEPVRVMSRQVKYRSLVALYPVLTGRLA